MDPIDMPANRDKVKIPDHVHVPVDTALALPRQDHANEETR